MVALLTARIYLYHFLITNNLTVEKLIWICIIVDVLASVALVLASMTSGQDAAGKAMLILPIILLLLMAIGAYLLKNANHNGWALTISGIPAVIVVVILLFTFSQGLGNK